MKFEYKYRTIEINDEQRQMVEIGLINQEAVTDIMIEVINEEAKDGWEPLYPFSFPSVFFKREKKITRKKTDTQK
jgi:hypothetical protein